MTYVPTCSIEGKTVEDVHEGYEELRIEFEDGTHTTYRGGAQNPRDI